MAGRFDVDSVLEFLALGPVRERFGFDDDSLGVISEWVEATGVRWGLDPSQRERLGLPGSVVTNTWAAAVDRLLVGSAVFDEDLRLAIGDVAPYGVEGGDVETIGSLAAVMGCLADLAADGIDHPTAGRVDRAHRPGVCGPLRRRAGPGMAARGFGAHPGRGRGVLRAR